MIGSPTVESLRKRLRHVHAAVVEFREALDAKCTHAFLLIALKDKQEQLWKRLEPRLARVRADAAQGCTVSLHWIGDHLDELGYVLARGELLARSSADAMQRCAEDAAESAERLTQARRERDAWVARAMSLTPGEKATRHTPPRVILQRTELAHASVEPIRTEAAKAPSSDHGVGSEAWQRQLEAVRQQSIPATVGFSRAEDVIPRK